MSKETIMPHLTYNNLQCPYCGRSDEENYDCVYSIYEYEDHSRCFVNFHCFDCDEMWWNIVKVPKGE